MSEEGPVLIPIGYNARIREVPREWLGNDDVVEVLSVGECVSDATLEHREIALCNSWGLYDTLEVLEQALARSDLHEKGEVRRFFYEIHSEALECGEWLALPRTPEGVVRPEGGFERVGFDVVCSEYDEGVDHSPLYCNSGAEKIRVNRYCLLDDFEEAKAAAVRIDAEGGYEPGPYGIVAVHRRIGE